MVSKQDEKIYKSDFESHWVPNGLVPHLSKKLCKIRLLKNRALKPWFIKFIWL